MRVMSIIFTAVAFAAFAVGPLSSPRPAFAACDPGDRPDKSTADDAKKKIQAAGYRDVRSLKKGCDNYWHGTATKDGAQVYVVLSPQGEVIVEERG
ncbi:MAG: PepSY domain-containing protein [Gemmatimonas sp.]